VSEPKTAKGSAKKKKSAGQKGRSRFSASFWGNRGKKKNNSTLGGQSKYRGGKKGLAAKSNSEKLGAEPANLKKVGGQGGAQKKKLLNGGSEVSIGKHPGKWGKPDLKLHRTHAIGKGGPWVPAKKLL